MNGQVPMEQLAADRDISVPTNDQRRPTANSQRPTLMISISTGFIPLMMNWMPMAPRSSDITLVKTARPRTLMTREMGRAASSTAYDSAPTAAMAMMTANFWSISG